MEETGIVTAVEGDEAVIRFERTEACKKCGACQLGQDGEMLLRVQNTLGAKTGDRVGVALREGELFAASLLAYGLPLAGLIGGLLLGGALAPLFPSAQAELVMAICAALLIAAAFVVNRLLEPLRKRRRKYQPIPVKLDRHGE